MFTKTLLTMTIMLATCATLCVEPNLTQQSRRVDVYRISIQGTSVKEFALDTFAENTNDVQKTHDILVLKR